VAVLITDVEPVGNGNYDVILQRVPGGNPRWWWYFGVDAAFVNRATQENNARVIDLKRYGDRYAFVMIDNTQ
jgi:hypothetical protein